jgi:hypothetical protein
MLPGYRQGKYGMAGRGKFLHAMPVDKGTFLTLSG